MLKRITALLISIAFVAIAASIGLNAADRRHIETFETKENCDTLYTTALWDTVAGEVRLANVEISLLSSYPAGADVQAVALAGNYAFLAASEAGLIVVDISDPGACAFAGSRDTPGSASGVAVEGNYAFVADGEAGLQIIDITDPSVPTISGSYDTQGNACAVAVHGDYALVADGSSGLLILDISNPAAPSYAGGEATSGEACGVDVEGNIACIADGSGGLRVIDITDPSSPKTAGTYDSPGSASDVDLDGDNVYLADGSGGLLVIDIRDMEHPALLGSFTTPFPALGLCVAGTHVYVGVGLMGFWVIDVSDKSAPSFRDSYATPGYCRDLAAAGEYAFAASGTSGMLALDVASHCGFRQGGYSNDPSQPFDFALSGDYMYVTDNPGVLFIIDTSDPTEWYLPLASSLPLYDSDTRCIAVAGDLALVGGHTYVSAVDIKYPELPNPVGLWNLDGRNAVDIAISGDHAYVITGASSAELVTLDLSNPWNPDSIAACAVSSYTDAIEIEGDVAYLVHEYGGLEAVDISDPSSPAVMTVLPLTGRPVDIAVSGDIAYIAGYDSVMIAVDISDPSAPSLLGSLPLEGRAICIDVAGDIAMIGGEHIFFKVDISDPAAPALMETAANGSEVYKISLEGDFIYCVDEYMARRTKVMNRLFECEGMIAQSEDLNRIDAWVVGIDCRGYEGEVELSGLVNIEFSANGMYWYWHGRDGYEDLDTWGDGLYWRSEHLTSPADPEMNAILSHLEFVPFYYCAIIDSIVDVPRDQGGWARVHFTCSGIDHPDSERDEVIGYTVFRRIDDPALLDAIDEGSGLIETPRVDKTGYFVKGGGIITALPEGIWESVAYTASMPTVEYICLVPTLEDSSATFDYSVYCVFAQMGFGGGSTSPPDSGYSVDNLPPAAPLNLSVEYNTGSGNHVTWDPSPEPDFQLYRVFRGDNESFVPGPASLVYETTLPEWTDPSYDGWNVHYKVISVDASGNESEPASAGTTTGVDDQPLPHSFALYQNVPNPFNPVTTIRFDLPRAVHVKLCVYNVKGELVRTLVDRYMTEGRKEIAWPAKSDQGTAMASGIYFYRLVAGDFVLTRKMVLLR